MRYLLLALLLLVGVALAQSVLDIYDVSAICDPTTMDVETLWTSDTSIAGYGDFATAEIRFNSFGDDTLTIRIQGFVAMPEGGSNLPAIVCGHGLGGEGSLEYAIGTAALMNACALSISAPGQGGSEGRSSDDVDNIINTVPDPRGSWFYQYAYAAMRGITYLSMLSCVDTNWLCITGASAGGVISFIANGVDSRIRYSIPILAAGNWWAAYADSSWILTLAPEGLDTTDERVQQMEHYLDPIHYAPYQHGFTTMIIGAQDEFFPLNCTAPTYDSLDVENARIEVIANWDHAVYFANGEGYYDSFDNSTVAATKTAGTTRSIFQLLRSGVSPPMGPIASAVEESDAILFSATLESPLASSLTLWISLDTAWTFTSYDMPRSGTGYAVSVPLDRSRYSLDNIIYFVEWDIVPSVGYALSSNPYVPAGLHPRVRPAEPPDAIAEARDAHSALIAVSPNPTTSVVRIDGAVSQAMVYSVDGRFVKKLNSAVWDCKDENGRYVSPGVYLISVECGGERFFRSVTLVR